MIWTPDRRLRVFLSSTLGELAAERRAVMRAVSALRLTPVLFELGARPHPPRDLYRAYLAQSDVFVGLYWQRYGYVAEGMEVSGLEEEFDLSAGLPRLLYIKAPAPDREPRLAALLERLKSRASYRAFHTPAELSRLVRDDLASLLSERFAASRPSSSSPASAKAPRLAPLPVGTTSLVGRDDAIEEVAGLLSRPEVRLVTLTGTGGIGKTRLAVAVGERLRGDFSAGTVFVPLATATRPEVVLETLARAVGANLVGMASPFETLVEQLGDGRWLLILDNLEQVIDVAGDLDRLLGQCPRITILATSRTVLQLRAEREYAVPPLSLPADPTCASVAELASSPAVALFVDRARAVRRDFALSEGNAAAVVELCRRLEGAPLAIELAAARTRLLEPAALLQRLARSLDALGSGAVDMPQRQHTLRATVEWSIGLLDEDERSLLETMAVFVDGWTIEAAADVAGLDEDRALELTEALARHSLLRLDRKGSCSRERMLETVRAFVAERLAARPDLATIQRRHADHYRTLVEQADVGLRGVGHREWLERLQAEAGNVAAAIRWYSTHDVRPLPHLFRILWTFWFVRDLMRESCIWIGDLLPALDSLDPHARAELVWTGLVAALEVGDDVRAQDASERLTALLDGIDDPFLHAVSLLALAWSSPIVGETHEAVARTVRGLEELHGQHEPYWTALTAGFLGSLETLAGRYDDALVHLREMRELAERFEIVWLAAWAQSELAILAVKQDRLDDARRLLDEGLGESLASGSTRSVSICVAAFAQLVFKEGAAERAALLAGAAEGLRQRTGLRVWPCLREEDEQLRARARGALGVDRFDRAFAAGARLSQREAVALVREKRGAAVDGHPPRNA